MNDNIKAVINLILCAVNETSLPTNTTVKTDGEFETIRKHQIISLGYRGALACGMDRNSPEMVQLFQDYCRCLTRSVQQNREYEDLCALFEKAEIDYMPIKGAVLRGVYPKPDMRAMGDIDILIRIEQYGRIRKLLTENGYKSGNDSDYELRWSRNGVEFELHQRMVSASVKVISEYYKRPWDFAENVTGTHRYQMSAEDHFVYIFAHFTKHYTESGIGCRHMTDLWVYKRFYPDMDEDYIGRELKKLSLYTFYENVMKTLDVWFNGGESDGVTELISDTIFGSGVFGTRARSESYDAANAQKGRSGIGNKIKYLFRRMFMPYKMMAGRYPVLKKAPILLPFFWIYRLFWGIICRRKTVETAFDRLNRWDPEEIDRYRNELQSVGLSEKF